MIWFTIDQAAQRVHRSPETIRRWLRDELLTVRREAITGERYVTEGELLQVEKHLRGRENAHRFTAA